MVVEQPRLGGQPFEVLAVVPDALLHDRRSGPGKAHLDRRRLVGAGDDPERTAEEGIQAQALGPLEVLLGQVGLADARDLEHALLLRPMGVADEKEVVLVEHHAVRVVEGGVLFPPPERVVANLDQQVLAGGPVELLDELALTGVVG